MSKRVHIHYFTKEKNDLVNPDNRKKYNKYLKSNIIKNLDVKETTYKVYENYFNQFLVYLAEEWDNIDVYSEDFTDNALDIMEGFMSFCQVTLLNNKKIINTKISAVSSFYLWSVKRKEIKFHPFQGQLDRMKGSREEHIIGNYFLNDEQILGIQTGLVENIDNKFDLLDLVLWNVMLDSANRIGAIDRLTLSSFDIDECCFRDIREKEGYIIDVSVNENTAELIHTWLEYRKEHMDNLEIDALFISRYGGVYKKMSKGTLQSRIKKMGTIIGIEDFRSHCIRKTASNSMLSKGIDPSLVSRYLNHKDVSTTLSFYQKPKSSVEIRDAIKKQIKLLSKKKEEGIEDVEVPVITETQSNSFGNKRNF
jgi:integrase/recombinase XerC